MHRLCFDKIVAAVDKIHHLSSDAPLALAWQMKSDIVKMQHIYTTVYMSSIGLGRYCFKIVLDKT